MTDKAVVLFSTIAILFALLLAALFTTVGLYIKKRRSKRDRMSLLNMPKLSEKEERALRKKGGHTGSVKTITAASPEVTAKIVKSWLSKEGK